MSNRCLRCGYQWSPRSDKPFRCPRCKSTRWDKTSVEHKCLRCGAEWEQRSEKLPRYCPECHSSMWNEARSTYTCPKCGKVVVLRSNSRIGMCPDCDAYSDRRNRYESEYAPRMSGPGRIVPIWSDGHGLSMYYCEGTGMGLVYHNGNVIGSRRIENMLRGQGAAVGNVTKEKDPSLFFELESMSKCILSDRDVLDISDADSKKRACLQLFKEGMTPVAISLKLGMPFTEVMDIVSASKESESDNRRQFPGFVSDNARDDRSE